MKRKPKRVTLKFAHEQLDAFEIALELVHIFQCAEPVPNAQRLSDELSAPAVAVALFCVEAAALTGDDRVRLLDSAWSAAVDCLGRLKAARTSGVLCPLCLDLSLGLFDDLHVSLTASVNQATAN
jgi:hypothetical protein